MVKTVNKSVAVLYYNQIKQEIDVSDKMVSYHRCLRKSIRWFHKVAMDTLLGIAVVNACSLMNERCRAANVREMQIAEFREHICEQPMRHGQRTNVSQILNNASGHFLHETEMMQSGKRPNRRVKKYCVGCYTQLKEIHGRETARKKSKTVVIECALLFCMFPEISHFQWTRCRYSISKHCQPH